MSGGDDNVSDTQLMQYLHDELSAADRAHIDAQLAAKPVVAERLDVLRQRSSRLSLLLAAADPRPADVQASAAAIRAIVERDLTTHEHWWRRTPPALRAAAAIALLLGAVLLVEPARAWVLDRARAVAEAVGLVAAAPSDNAAPVEPEGGADMRVSFPWSSSTFDIAAGSAAGTLMITTGRAGEATAEIAGTSGASLMVVPAGIRIEGAGGAAATYTLTLPPAVSTVRLIREDSTVEHAVPADGSMLRLPLR
jgi:hypothetical protein